MSQSLPALSIAPETLRRLSERAAVVGRSVADLIDEWLDAPPVVRCEGLQSGLTLALEMAARERPLAEILTQLILALEKEQPTAKGSVLLLDAATNKLRHCAAPSLPDAYMAATDGLEIGPAAGSCGTAAYHKRLVVVSDIQTDPLWAAFRSLATQYDLRACWSQPILSETGATLGTFAFYYDHPREPRPDELELIQTAVHIAGIAISHDQSARALRDSEARQRAILQAIPDLMFRIRRDGTFVDYHARSLADLALPPEQFMGQTITAVMPPDLAQQHMAYTESVLATGEPAVYEYALPLGDNLRWFEARAVVCGPDEMLSIVRDVTERKKIAAQQAALEIERQRVNLLNEFVQTTSHELRTPLAVINTNLYLVSKAKDEQRQAEYLENSRLQIERLTRLLDMVAAMIRLDQNTPFEYEAGDLNQAAAKALAQMGASLNNKGQRCQFKTDAALPRVLFDFYQITEAIKHLLDNAIRFTPEGELIGLRVYQAGEAAVVEVSDSGAGIKPEAQPYIFERFWRDDGAHTTPGFGLGLPIVHEIVNRHGGKIEMETTVDQGSLFRIFLPLAQLTEPIC
jgi:PAS domain S-box-containing protein